MFLEYYIRDGYTKAKFSGGINLVATQDDGTVVACPLGAAALSFGIITDTQEDLLYCPEVYSRLQDVFPELGLKVYGWTYNELDKIGYPLSSFIIEAVDRYSATAEDVISFLTWMREGGALDS